MYAPEPFDVGRILQAEIISDGQNITLTTTGPIDPGLVLILDSQLYLGIFLWPCVIFLYLYSTRLCHNLLRLATRMHFLQLMLFETMKSSIMKIFMSNCCSLCQFRNYLYVYSFE